MKRKRLDEEVEGDIHIDMRNEVCIIYNKCNQHQIIKIIKLFVLIYII